MRSSPHVKQEVSARIPTVYGTFQLILFKSELDSKEHLALVMGNIAGKENVLVRIHSECFTGDVMGSLRCDCGEQLKYSMQKIGEIGEGVLIYLRQEGRGIGLADKLRAYNLQDMGYDTVDANLLLGHEPDERDFSIAAYIIQALKIKSVRLMTNNPEKINQLIAVGVPIVSRVPIEIQPRPENILYLRAKKERMHHWLSLKFDANV